MWSNDLGTAEISFLIISRGKEFVKLFFDFFGNLEKPSEWVKTEATVLPALPARCDKPGDQIRAMQRCDTKRDALRRPFWSVYFKFLVSRKCSSGTVTAVAMTQQITASPKPWAPTMAKTSEMGFAAPSAAALLWIYSVL